MPPPAIAKIAAGTNAENKGGAPTSTLTPNKVGNRIQKPTATPKRSIEFSRFPAEIQEMVWREAMQKPACHTFKFARPRDPPFCFNPSGPYTMELSVLPSTYDPSAYRQWKSMLWNGGYKLAVEESEKPVNKRHTKTRKSCQEEGKKPKIGRPKLEGLELVAFNIEKANLDNRNKPSVQKSQESFSKLANASFQAGFRRSMLQLQPILAHTPAGNRMAAAIDAATDLVILEFDRGRKADLSSWFEHNPAGRMAMGDIRNKTRHLKRVAVHYKKSHAGAGELSPFQCWCPAGSQLQCKSYKACPVEQACFLDCFANIEEFYYVVEVTKKKELAWCDEYKGHARRQGYKLNKTNNPEGEKLELSHSFDLKKEFLQLCPQPYLEFLPKTLRTDPVLPLEVMGKPHNCLVKVSNIYQGKQGNETFINSVEQREKVKFGMLVGYNLLK